MAKVTTSKKPKRSSKKSLKVHIPFSSRELKDSQVVVEALLECLRIGDLDSLREVLMSHLMTVSKVAIAKKAGIGRRTLYDLLDPDKEFNPQLTTLSALIQSIAA